MIYLWNPNRQNTLLCVAILCFSIVFDARSAVVVTVEEVANDVVFSANGSLNTSSLNRAPDWENRVAGFNSDYFALGSSFNSEGTHIISAYSYYPTTHPGDFAGFGPIMPADDAEGLGIGASKTEGSQSGFIFLDRTYLGGSFNGSKAKYFNTTISDIGLIPGSYTWSWGTDSLTLNVVPLPAAAWFMLSGVVGLVGLRYAGSRRAANETNCTEAADV